MNSVKVCLYDVRKLFSQIWKPLLWCGASSSGSALGFRFRAVMSNSRAACGPA